MASVVPRLADPRRRHRASVQEPLPHRGRAQIRDFIFVEDVVDALHFALATPIPRGTCNLGTGTGRTFLDLARATFAALGAPERIEFIDMPVELRERYQYFTEARTERLRAAGYRTPFTTLEDGVRQYVQRLKAV
jgi:ADP-L-glycero-D-manno-heptose 6-epimerase